MADESNLRNLEEKLNKLLETQEQFTREITSIKRELEALKSGEEIAEPAPEKIERPAVQEKVTSRVDIGEWEPEQEFKPIPPKQTRSGSDLERFIGENLINKIGIVVTVIGVGLGVKYAIDRELISPLIRILLGYLFGGSLLYLSYRLKKNYESYSAVLLSGAVAILYLMTFLAFSLYSLFPQPLAFAFMVGITVYTVISALRFDNQVIAHYGMVGAYAVPFLLDTGSGRYELLFGYMTVINIGILYLAYRRDWRPLQYTSFIISWLVFFSWFGNRYQPEHFGTGFTFLVLFFFLFYANLIIRKLSQKLQSADGDVLLLLVNAFLFYGIGNSMFDRGDLNHLIGLFTLANAIVHFGVCYLIQVRNPQNKLLIDFTLGLGLLFISITIPLEFTSQWIAWIWALEAALLFWLGRSRPSVLLELSGLILLPIAGMALIIHWVDVYQVFDKPGYGLTTLFNEGFLSTVIVAGAIGFMLYSAVSYSYKSNNLTRVVYTTVIGLAILIVLYTGIRLEFEAYWRPQISAVKKSLDWLADTTPWRRLIHLKRIWVLSYSMLFLATFQFINAFVAKHKTLGLISAGFSALAILTYLTQGNVSLYKLMEYYTHGFQETNWLDISIRYISIGSLVLLLGSYYAQVQQGVFKNVEAVFNLFIHAIVLWMLTSELLYLLKYAGVTNANKLATSILWGCYSLFLIVMGISRRLKYLRVSAIVLFGITLVKLFLYDLSNLDNASKTIVFIALGVLLLIISFLYNKFKSRLNPD